MKRIEVDCDVGTHREETQNLDVFGNRTSIVAVTEPFKMDV